MTRGNLRGAVPAGLTEGTNRTERKWLCKDPGARGLTWNGCSIVGRGGE